MTTKSFVVVLTLGILLGSTVALAGDQPYQQGKVISVDKLPAPTTGPGNSDTVMSNPTSTFNVVVRLGNKDYTCRYQAVNGSDLAGWLPGRDVKVRVQGKVMHILSDSGNASKAPIIKVETVKE
jgi:hypothetical protein